MSDERSIEELAERLGLDPESDRAWLEPALEHPSYAHERRGDRGNERLEYLGDAVLDLAIGDLLYRAHAGWDEGSLTRARASLVNTAALAERAREIKLGACIRLGRTELRGKGSEKPRILANAFEALLGASYLARGYEPTRALIARLFRHIVENPLLGSHRDPKTAFQEWAHAHRELTPRYQVLSDSGIENSAERFEV
ncbi:MAG: ribonuclease III, partial [Myxococcales bacterium]|nr:ribonuclease III [Myxococcales bacterium]